MNKSATWVLEFERNYQFVDSWQLHRSVIFLSAVSLMKVSLLAIDIGALSITMMTQEKETSNGIHVEVIEPISSHMQHGA